MNSNNSLSRGSSINGATIGGSSTGTSSLPPRVRPIITDIGMCILL
jgi:hypothetical protein